MPAQKIQEVDKSLIDNIIRFSKEDYGWEIEESMNQTCSRMYYMLFSSIANFLAKVKSVDGKVSLVIEDQKQNPCFVAIVECHKSPDDDMPANYTLSFSFDPQDVEGGTVYYSTNNEFKEIALVTAEQEYGFQFVTENVDGDKIEVARQIITQIIGNVARCIRLWVEENSNDTQVRMVEIKGLVVIEAQKDASGEKVFAITPTGELKNIIKDDAAIETKMERDAAAKEAA